MSDPQDLQKLEEKLAAAIAAAGDEKALEEARVAALGKKGEISRLMKGLGQLAPEERKARGQALNRLKGHIAGLINARRQALREAAIEARLKNETVDVSLPVRPEAEGAIQPVSHVWEEIV